MNRKITNLIVVGVLLMVATPFNSFPTKTKKEKKPGDIRIAMLQMNPEGYDVHANMLKGEEFCREAKEMGADLVLFPEIWSIGYSRYHWEGAEKYSPEKYPLSFEAWKNTALDEQSAYVQHFKNLAKDLDMAIAITYLEKWDPLPRNSVSIIGADGEIKMTYAKVHTSDMKLTESNCTPGDDFYVCDLELGSETVKIGAMICFDREFPESARILMLKGAEIILTPNACGLEEKRINQFQTRAVENALAVVMTNYAAPAQNGHSCAFNANGDKIIVAGEEEGIYLADLNIGEIRKHRARTIWGNAYRRPLKYKQLLSNELDSVFIRSNDVGQKFDRTKR